MTGKVPALQLPAPTQQPRLAAPAKQSQPTIDEMYPKISQQQTDPLRLRASEPASPEYRQPDPRRMRPNGPGLPRTGPLSSPSQQQQISRPEILEDDINPFTGNLPALLDNDNKNDNKPAAQAYSYAQNVRAMEDEMVASRIVPDKKPMHYKLWAYMDQSSAEGFDVQPDEQPIYTQQGMLNDR